MQICIVGLIRIAKLFAVMYMYRNSGLDEAIRTVNDVWHRVSDQ